MPGPDSSAAKPDTSQYCNVLLVWEEPPEDSTVYHLQLGVDDFRRVCACHAKYINGDELTEQEDADLNWLNNFLVGKDTIFKASKCYEGNTFQPYLMMNPCTVVVCGFIC